jgi:hypothetical protein
LANEIYQKNPNQPLFRRAHERWLFSLVSGEDTTKLDDGLPWLDCYYATIRATLYALNPLILFCASI